MNLSRRDFIKVCGAGAAALGLGAKFAEPVRVAKKAVPTGPHATVGVLVDTTQCVGCRTCQRACKVANNLPADDTVTSLSATTLTIVDMRNVSPTLDKPVIKPVKRQCMHCEEPACVSVCPVAALYKREDGTVAYDAEKCIGCRYCMTACPFGVPKYDWNSPNPKINKCARDCMASGKLDRPACVQACPAQALSFGSRDQLLAVAHDRIAKNPDKYVKHIYGEKEVGGTDVLYLSGVSFESLGFRSDLPNAPIGQYTMNVMEKVPWVLGTVLAALSGIAWWTHREERLQGRVARENTTVIT